MSSVTREESVARSAVRALLPSGHIKEVVADSGLNLLSGHCVLRQFRLLLDLVILAQTVDYCPVYV